MRGERRGKLSGNAKHTKNANNSNDRKKRKYTQTKGKDRIRSNYFNEIPRQAGIDFLPAFLRLFVIDKGKQDTAEKNAGIDQENHLCQH